MAYNANIRCPICNEIYIKWEKHRVKCQKCQQCLEFCTADVRLMASHFQLCVTGRGFKCDKCPKLFERQTDRVDHELLCQSCPRGCGKAFTPRGKAHHDRNCPLNRSEGSAYLQPSTPGAVAASLPLSPISSSKHRLPSQPVLVSGDNRADTPSPSNPDDGFEPQAQAPEPPSLIAEYESKAAKALEDAKALYVTQQRESRKNSRAELDSVEMIKYLEKCSLGKIISAEEYLRINPDSRPKDSVVVCDMEQGGRILDRAPPLIPMLVVEGRGARRMTISEFLVVLRAREHLDVHDFRASIDKKSRAYQPKRLKSGKALDLYDERRDAKGEPVNFLNLGLIKDNAVPECFRDRMEYKMIELARTNNGKLEEPAFNDFDDCTGFQLLASKGAAHLAHIDRHGVYTTALNEEGKKLWLLWPNVPLEDLQGDVPDGGIAIFIDEGDMLIQPPNTLHAPITLEDCLMTGTMHWHSSHLLSILQYTKAEIENPALTNEAMARQFIPKMTILLELWKNDPKAYPWPPQKDLEEAFHILDWLKDGCDCGGICNAASRKNPCLCLTRDRACDDRCHYADNSKPCWQYKPRKATEWEIEAQREQKATKRTGDRVLNEGNMKRNKKSK